jgi:hypothetical protein
MLLQRRSGSDSAVGCYSDQGEISEFHRITVTSSSSESMLEKPSYSRVSFHEGAMF